MVVYVPGIDGSGELLFATADDLARHYRLVCLRYEADGEASYSGLAGSIVECLSSLGGTEPPVLLAESFGGAVALQTALDHRERVGALMIVNSFARYPKQFGLACTRLAAPLLHPVFRLLRNWFGVSALFGPRRDPELVQAFRSREGGGMDTAYRQRLAMIRGLDLLPRLGEVTLPVALLAADRDRVVPSVRCGRVMATRLPDATFEVLEDAGHLVLPIASFGWITRIDALLARVAKARRSHT